VLEITVNTVLKVFIRLHPSPSNCIHSPSNSIFSPSNRIFPPSNLICETEELSSNNLRYRFLKSILYIYLKLNMGCTQSDTIKQNAVVAKNITIEAKN
jgi:hypothetical protein